MRLLVFSSALCAALTLGACDRMNSDRANTPMTTPEPPAAQAPSADPVQSATADTAITGKVMAALAVVKDVNGSAISVETNNGRVVLSGRLPDQAQIDRAVSAAKAVEGVREVESRISIG